MEISRIIIHNFRGIRHAELYPSKHCVLVGDNNTGKSTVLEAIDLVLGPERLKRFPAINEHDFFAGEYVRADEDSIEVRVEVVVTGLSDEQERHFRSHLEWWNCETDSLIQGPKPEATDDDDVVPALRVFFVGRYDSEEDDFVAQTYFSSPTPTEEQEHDVFRSSDKRYCGFLFLRTLRTGARALSMQRGSLLDIILRLKGKRLQVWESVLGQLRDLDVAENDDADISALLLDLQEAVRSFVPSEWADNPHLRVSSLTREDLRSTLTVFLATGVEASDGRAHAVPFKHQGTGTVNMLVLALLSMIANERQNVIFAMEEPEIAIPPHAQKRVVHGLRDNSAQVLLTSHSPYVLEEFDPSEIIIMSRTDGNVDACEASLPPAVKPKAYKSELRRKYCEALLARRVLVTEGQTEYDAWPAAARKLSKLAPDRYRDLDALGFAIVNAETDSQVAPITQTLKKLGKQVLAVFDHQADPAVGEEIERLADWSLELPTTGFEKFVVQESDINALRRFARARVRDGEWPTHITPAPSRATADDELKKLMLKFFKWSKGSASAAFFLSRCKDEAEMPVLMCSTLADIRSELEALPNSDKEETTV